MVLTYIRPISTKGQASDAIHVDCYVTPSENDGHHATLTFTAKDKEGTLLPSAPAELSAVQTEVLNALGDAKYTRASELSGPNGNTFVYNFPELLKGKDTAFLEARLGNLLSRNNLYPPTVGAKVASDHNMPTVQSSGGAPMVTTVPGSYIHRFEDGTPPAVVQLERMDDNGRPAVHFTLSILQPDNKLQQIDHYLKEHSHSPALKTLQAKLWTEVRRSGLNNFDSTIEFVGVNNDMVRGAFLHKLHNDLTDQDAVYRLGLNAVKTAGFEPRKIETAKSTPASQNTARHA